MSGISIEDLLFEARRSRRSLPPAAALQLLCAMVRAAGSQGLAPLPGMFLLDADDGLVLDLGAAEAGHPPVQAAGELGRSLLAGQSGEVQGPAAAVVRRALQRGFETLDELREALEQVSPKVPAAAVAKILTGLAELVAAWQGGSDGGALPDALDTLAGGPIETAAPSRQAPVPPGAAPARPLVPPPPAPASAPARAAPAVEPDRTLDLAIDPAVPAPPLDLATEILAPLRTPPRADPIAAPVSAPSRPSPRSFPIAPAARPPASNAPPRPLPSSSAPPKPAPIEPLLREVEPPRAGAWRTVATIAISAAAGALGATAVFKLGAEPPPPPPAPQQVADARPLVCPPVLIVHEPAQDPPSGAPRAATDPPDAGVQIAQAASPQDPPPHAEKPPARTTRAAASRPARRKEKPAAQSGAQSEVDKGERALRKGQLEEAMSAFQAALARDERFAPAIRGLAMVHMTQGREADAKREYERYLRLAPNAPDASRIRKVVANLGAQ